jgi:hypothetical protein
MSRNQPASITAHNGAEIYHLEPAAWAASK